MSTSKEINVTGLLGYKLKQTQHTLRLRMDEVLRTLDLTTPQYAVLAQLELRPGLSNAALARFSFITAQTMHGIVSNLEKRHLVKRKSDPQHGRILCAELTKQGMKVVQQAHNIISKVEASMTSTITEDNKVLLEKLLLECFNNLHANRMAHDIEDQCLKEVTNLTYNYVLSGFHGDNPIILKASLDSEGLAREAFALKCFAGCDVVKVLSEDNGMLLLERAIPGRSLKGYFPTKEKESIEIACGVIKKLHQANIPKDQNFPHIKDWLVVLDKDWPIPLDYLQKARNIRDHLLKTSGSDVLLHGDLHHDNILQNGNGWLVIDPKGVIGESAYEVAAFIRNPMPELLTHADAPNIVLNRITSFAAALELPERRIIDWCFVQAVLSWIWALEDLSHEALVQGDGCDAGYFKKVVKIFDRINMN